MELNKKVAAIVPAFNEEATIGDVLKTILESRYFDEVIVVAGASTDDTVNISRKLGAKVIVSKEREGKGMAMKIGASATDAEIIVFFDADLIGLCVNHIKQLINPVLKDEVVMCTGARGHYLGLPYIFSKIDPLLAIGGERAVKRTILENIPEKFIKNFAIETALNYYCKIKKLPVRIVELKNIKLVPKEKKRGLVKGFFERVLEIWQIIKIRLTLLFNKNEFI